MPAILSHVYEVLRRQNQAAVEKNQNKGTFWGWGVEGEHEGNFWNSIHILHPNKHLGDTDVWISQKEANPCILL